MFVNNDLLAAVLESGERLSDPSQIVFIQGDTLSPFTEYMVRRFTWLLCQTLNCTVTAHIFDSAVKFVVKAPGGAAVCKNNCIVHNYMTLRMKLDLIGQLNEIKQRDHKRHYP